MWIPAPAVLWNSVSGYFHVYSNYSVGGPIFEPHTRLLFRPHHSQFIFFLSFSLVTGWQLSIWNCCKPFLSLLYNCQLLCFWRLALSIVVEVFPLSFFQNISPSRMFTTNSLCLTVCPIREWRLFFLNF